MDNDLNLPPSGNCDELSICEASLCLNEAALDCKPIKLYSENTL